jgi:ADP-ribosylation factor-like protein 1
MGGLLSRVFEKVFGHKQVRVLILGLDNAGKTTILHKLHNPNQVMRTMPTIGFNMETIEVKNLSFQVWDLGGQTNIRPYWRCYYANTNAIIYVVDSADRERMDLARKELMAMFEEDELKETILLVMANKQDQKNAMSEAEVSKALALHTIRDRAWHIVKTCALKNEGLEIGLDWVFDTITGGNKT